MLSRQDPRLKRKPGTIRINRHKTVQLKNHPFLALQLLIQHVAEYASVLVIEITFRADEFFLDAFRRGGGGDKLEVLVLEVASAGYPPVVFKNEDICS